MFRNRTFHHVPVSTPRGRTAPVTTMTRRATRTVAAGALAALLAAAAVVATPSGAQALSPGLAFSADDLPTWQTDGTAYAIATSGNTVVVGGVFTTVRSPDGGSGTERALPGLVLLDADTGAPTSCQFPVGHVDNTPTVNALTTSPDGATVYVGGDFSSIGGVTVSRIAAIDVAACTVKDLRAKPSSFVYGLAASADTLYVAGRFNQMNDEPRPDFAAIDATTGALKPWRADGDGDGRALALSPDGTKVVVGGTFSSINAQYSHSVAVVDAQTGANVKNYPPGFLDPRSATKTIAVDSTGFYIGNEGTGFEVFDGRIAFDWSTLEERWRDTCLGATQAVLPYRGILYSANHVHNCRTMKYFPEGKRHYFYAQSTTDAGIRAWTPEANGGNGERVGGRALAIAQGSSGNRYLYAAGEFTMIGGHVQQGITRFGSVDTGAPPVPQVQVEALTAKAIQIRILTSVDEDDATLTYRVYRTGTTKPIWTGTATSWWWSQPQITLTDKKRTSGKTYGYRVTVSDGRNTSAKSATVRARATSRPPTYPRTVIADGPRLFWRYDEPSGFRVAHKGANSRGSLNGRLRGTKLNVAGIQGRGASFDGVDDYVWNDQLLAAPKTFSLETWFKTTTRSGGKIIGYTNGRPRTDNGDKTPTSTTDRQIYLDNAGRLNFGVYADTNVVLTAPNASNDGKWHHVVARHSSSGMALFVDGKTVARNTESRSRAYFGVWMVGGDSLEGWANRPTSDYFRGSLDETAVYYRSLSGAAVVKHYKAGR